MPTEFLHEEIQIERSADSQPLKGVEMTAKTGALTRTAPSRTFTWMPSR